MTSRSACAVPGPQSEKSGTAIGDSRNRPIITCESPLGVPDPSNGGIPIYPLARARPRLVRVRGRTRETRTTTYTLDLRLIEGSGTPIPEVRISSGLTAVLDRCPRSNRSGTGDKRTAATAPPGSVRCPKVVAVVTPARGAGL